LELTFQSCFCSLHFILQGSDWSSAGQQHRRGQPAVDDTRGALAEVLSRVLARPVATHIAAPA
jgi:hypothetical protein